MLIYSIGTVLLGSILNNQLSRKRIQDKLKENEAKLQNFIDNVPVGMFRTSSERKVIQTNPEMAYILGLKTPEQVIRYIEDGGEQLFVDPKNIEDIVAQIRKQGYVKHFEFEALHSDGKRIWLLMNARKNCQLKGETFTIDGFVHDITERKGALLQAMQEKHVTVAGARHDLPHPFHVLATQNPLEQEGTYPLPEAQLDRFLLQIDVGYPDLDAERRMLLATTMGDEKYHIVRPLTIGDMGCSPHQ